MMAQIKSNFANSREAAGVHERSFVQHGDGLIITIEGDDPAASWAQIISTMVEFAAFAADVHGLDVNAPPPPLPEMFFDICLTRIR